LKQFWKMATMSDLYLLAFMGLVKGLRSMAIPQLWVDILPLDRLLRRQNSLHNFYLVPQSRFLDVG
jgi:hypothetical protein